MSTFITVECISWFDTYVHVYFIVWVTEGSMDGQHMMYEWPTEENDDSTCIQWSENYKCSKDLKRIVLSNIATKIKTASVRKEKKAWVQETELEYHQLTPFFLPTWSMTVTGLAVVDISMGQPSACILSACWMIEQLIKLQCKMSKTCPCLKQANWTEPLTILFIDILMKWFLTSVSSRIKSK